MAQPRRYSLHRCVPSILRPPCEVLANLRLDVWRYLHRGVALELFQFAPHDPFGGLAAGKQAIGVGQLIIAGHDFRYAVLLQFALDEGDELWAGHRVELDPRVDRVASKSANMKAMSASVAPFS